MIKKFLSACVLANLLFNYSYSMEQESAPGENQDIQIAAKADDALSIINQLVIGQCYARLDAKIREFSYQKAQMVLDLIKQYSDSIGDVCATYHLCKNEHSIAKSSGVMLGKDTLDEMQKRFIFFLARIYIDVATCKSIIPTVNDDVYNFFKDKVKDVWYYQIRDHVANFGELTRSALGHISRLPVDKGPSPIWACYFQQSYLRCVGVKSHTVYFGDVDNSHDLIIQQNKPIMREARKAAVKKISDKIGEIATAKIPEQQKWIAFFSLNFKDI